MKILVTGANGFIGSYLIRSIAELPNHDPIALVHQSHNSSFKNIRTFHFDINSNENWKGLLEGIDVVIHTAARVHILNDSAKNPLIVFRAINTIGTLNFAQQAALSGVKRFIFLSSVKVLGEETPSGTRFSEKSPTFPKEPYAISKKEAEDGLLDLSEKTNMEVVIIRPPLVYGPGVKGNFRDLMNLLRWRIPLPLAAIDNKRSMVSLENLVNLIIICIDHPKAVNQSFLVSDNEDISTPELLNNLGHIMNYPVYLFPLNLNLLEIFATCLGQKKNIQRLKSSLQVDISKTRDLLCWRPPLSLNEGLIRVCEHKKFEQ